MKLLKIIKRQIIIFQTPFYMSIYVLIAGSLFIIGILGVYDTFTNKNQEVSSITIYYPFAIFAACSSICFSWVRAIDVSRKVKINRIRVCGESFLFSALIFLISTLFKYFSLYASSTSVTYSDKLKNYFSFMNWSYPFMFIIGYTVGAISIMRILVLLIFNRISMLDKSNPEELVELEK